ncbi:MAG: hypothetical protein NC086_10715, partial [Alistipes sp.]|nr:hypothetical protein [Alistipes sp.]
MFGRKIKDREFVDIHCHMIPAVDDGAKDMGTALAMARLSYEEGIRTIVATPHYHQGKMLCGEEEMRERFEEFRERVRELFPELTVLYGREVYLTYDAVERLLENEDGMCICGSKYVLAEFHTTVDYAYMTGLLRQVMFAGYLPVLAHIERYECLRGHEERIGELKSLKVVTQVNSLSVTGEEGKHIQKFIKKLIKEGLVDVVATDAHTTERRAPRM